MHKSNNYLREVETYLFRLLTPALVGLTTTSERLKLAYSALSNS